MERNLLFKEIQGLEFFSAAYLPLSAFKIPSMIQKVPPPKLDKDKTNGYTCYVAINLGLTQENHTYCTKYDRSDPKKPKCIESKTVLLRVPEKMTAIYIPDSFKATQKTDVIVYLHGHLAGVPGIKPINGIPAISPSIKDYLTYKPAEYFNFRKIINESKKNVVFVAPTLGHKSQYGNLATNFDGFIEQVIAAINEYFFKERKLEGQFNLGNLIMAAHSGGGKGMMDIAVQQGSRYAKLIKAFWGFDSWYNSEICSKLNNKNKCVEYKSWNDIAKNKTIKIYAYHYDSTVVPVGNNETVCVKPPVSKGKKAVSVGGKHFTSLPVDFKERISKFENPAFDCPSS